MPNTKNQTASPGTHIPGPLHIEAQDPAQTDFTALNAEITALTDSSGGTASDTIAAATNIDALTDSAGGTVSDTIAAAPITYSAADFNNVHSSLVAELTTQRALNTVLVNATASLAAKSNELRSDLEALKERIN